MTQILYSNIGDLTTSEVLTGDFLLLLADRNALPNHPALYQAPDIVGLGSSTIKIPQIGLMGYNKLTSETEVAAASTVALTDASATIALGRYTKRYEASDLAKIVDSLGFLRTEVLTMDALVSYSATIRDLVANLVDNFSSTVGTTTVDGSIEDILDACAILEIAAVGGPYLGVIHPRQWHDAVKDVALNIGGAVQLNGGAQSVMDAMMGLGFKGRFLGVDWFTTLDVPTANAGADRAGGIFGFGAIGWAQGPVMADPDLPQANVGPVLFEKDRTPTTATTGALMHGYLGASEMIDACGVTWISDA